MGTPLAFIEAFPERIRQQLARRKNVEEKKMFGGVGFLLNGNLLVGVWKDSLLVRLGPDESDETQGAACQGVRHHEQADEGLDASASWRHSWRNVNRTTQAHRPLETIKAQVASSRLRVAAKGRLLTMIFPSQGV